MRMTLCAYGHTSPVRVGLFAWKGSAPRRIRHLACIALLAILPAHPGARGHHGNEEARTEGGARSRASIDDASLKDVESAEDVLVPLRLSADDSHVRVTDHRLREVVERASEGSPTLHRIVTRIQGSDVVAYVEYDMHEHSTIAGHLTFVSAAAGRRYVLIRVGYLGVATTQAAVVGHELRHAVEVVEIPAITDVSSFQREYARIGFENGAGRAIAAESYETRAAQHAGDRILRELRESTD